MLSLSNTRNVFGGKADAPKKRGVPCKDKQENPTKQGKEDQEALEEDFTADSPQSEIETTDFMSRAKVWAKLGESVGQIFWSLSCFICCAE